MGSSPTAETIFISLLLDQRAVLEAMFLALSREPKKLAATSANKLQKWPKWNGEPSNFLLYFYRLKGKIKADRSKMGNNAAIYNQIIGTIPKDK